MTEEEFTPIIAQGIEYTGVSSFKIPQSVGVPSPRTPVAHPSLASPSPRSSHRNLLPPSTPAKLHSESFSAGNRKAVSENGRATSPRVLISHSKSLTYPGNNNYPLDGASTPSPWRSGLPRAGGGGSNPRAPVKKVSAVSAERPSDGHGVDYSSTPSPWRGVRGSEAGNSGAPVKQPVSAEYRLSNGHLQGHGNGYGDGFVGASSPASKSAPIRHLSFSRCSFKQVSVDIRRLRELARQGSWKRIIERVKDAQKQGLLAMPDQEIAYGTYHLLALMKLQEYRAASHEIAAFGDLNSPQYRYENHPELYPEKSGSMVPWSLRCMHAELPHRVGITSETLYRLYKLLNHCDSQIDALQAEHCLDTAPSISSEGREEPATGQEVVVEEAASANGDDLTEESVATSDIEILEGLLSTWHKRKEVVCFSIVGYHLHQQQFVVALQWLDKLMAKSPTDPFLQTKAALIQLQLGDVIGAQRTFSAVEKLVSLSPESPELKNLLGRSRGVLNVALGEFPKAIKEFDAVLARDPSDIVSANNKALCLLYNRQLLDAADTLENAIFNGPKWLVNEAVVTNICSMYEVVSFSSAAAKRSLRSWVKDHGPDDFHPSSFRI